MHATCAELPRYRPRRYAIHVGGEALDERALFIALANSRQYGNGAQIAPQARLDDGRLDLVVVRAQSLVRIVGQIPAFFRGTLRDGPGLVMRLAERVDIEGDRPIAVPRGRRAPERVDMPTRPDAAQTFNGGR